MWERSTYGVIFWQLCYQGKFEEARIEIGLKYSKTKEIIEIFKELYYDKKRITK